MARLTAWGIESTPTDGILSPTRKNPTVLWAHNSSSPPIGRMVNIFVTNEKLMGDVQFAPAPAYQFAETIYSLVNQVVSVFCLSNGNLPTTRLGPWASIFATRSCSNFRLSRCRPMQRADRGAQSPRPAGSRTARTRSTTRPPYRRCPAAQRTVTAAHHLCRAGRDSSRVAVGRVTRSRFRGHHRHRPRRFSLSRRREHFRSTSPGFPECTVMRQSSLQQGK